MKKLLLIIPALLIAGIFFYACQQDANVVEPNNSSSILYSVASTYYIDACKGPNDDGCIKVGDAASECAQVDFCAESNGCDFAYKWNEDPDGVGPLSPPLGDPAQGSLNGSITISGATITITNSDGYSFDWSISSGYKVCGVLVKAADGYQVYSYGCEGAGEDEGVFSVVKTPAVYDGEGNITTAATYYSISHITFCFKKVDMCYEEETAWAEGARYVKKGNWAMYVDYYGVEKTVELIADFTNYVHAGTVTFSAPVDGMVTITVNLTGGAIFYYDLNDPLYDDNLKVQDYAKAPTKTPSPGLFAWKTNIATGSTTGSIVVPVNNFYGVHTDIALPVTCE